MEFDMLKTLVRKWRFWLQSDNINTLLMYIVASKQINVKLPFEDNHGNITNRGVVGYNKTKVFIDVDGKLAWYYKDRIVLTNEKLVELIAVHKKHLVSKARNDKHLASFSHLAGTGVKVRCVLSGVIYNVPFFRNDNGFLMDSSDLPVHVPMVLLVDYSTNKILYLENLERVTKERA
jgi:hypothetical protein